MYGRKDRLKKLGINILLMIVGLVIVVGVTYKVQTVFSLSRQRENSETKFEVVNERLESHKEEAEEYLNRFDDFNQAKANVIAYFYSENPNQINGISEMADQWELKEIYILDSKNHIVKSNTHIQPDFNDKKFGELFAVGEAVGINETRYYAAAISDNRTLVAGRDSQECMRYIDELTSYSYSLSTIKVGTTGHIEVINKKDNTILYDPSGSFVGKKLKEVGFSQESFEEGFSGWIEFNGASYYGECKSGGDDILYLSMVPRAEISKIDVKMVFLAACVFTVVLAILSVYIHLNRIEEAEACGKKDEIRYRRIYKNFYFNVTIFSKVKRVIVIGLVAIFCLTFYVQSLGALSSQSIRSDVKQMDIATIFKENKSKVQKLTEEYNHEYIGRADNIAYLLKKDPRLVNDEKLKTLATKAQIRMIYVFNNRGAIDATNAAYKGFVLSKDEKDQSYEFWGIIRGNTNGIVQKAAKDDSSGEYLQYVGVPRDDAEGLIQLGINPQRLENRLQTAKANYILKNIAVENDGFLIGIAEKTQKVIFSNTEEQIGEKAEITGLKKTALVSGYSGYQRVNNQDCFVTSNIIDGTIVCVAVPVTSINSGRITTTLVVTGVSLLIMCLIATLSLVENMNQLKKIQVEGEKFTERGNETYIEIESTTSGEKKKVQSAASRWGSNKIIPWAECNSDLRMIRILRWSLDVIGILMVMYFYVQRNTYNKESVMSYIIHRKWEKIPNIFSFTYIAIVMLEIIVIATILRKIIMTVAKSMGTRAETVGRLMDSFIKYISVIGGVFHCMNFIGVNSSTLLASAGLLSLVIGLGAQSLISDILAGIFIVFEGEFRVGDIVTVDTWRGTVLEIGVRSTKIEDISGNIKVLNNSKITGVVNMTKKYSYAFCDVGLEYDESIERVEGILQKELPLFKERITAIEGGPYYKGVIELADSSVVIRIIAQCQEVDRIQLTRDLNREIKMLFDRYRIGIAYPQLVVHEPTIHVEATKQDRQDSEKYIKQQKEESKHVIVGD